MSQYKELADRLSTFINDEAFLDAVDEAAAILRSLDAQPVAWMHQQGSYKEPSLFELDNDELARGWAQSPLYAAPVAAQPVAPIDMVLFCPACGLQHIDAPEEVPGMPIYKSAPTPDMPHRMEQVGTYTGQGEWKNPPHRSHLCHDCGHIWRPADVPTNGVKAVKTVGKADSPIAAPVAAQPQELEALFGRAVSLLHQSREIVRGSVGEQEWLRKFQDLKNDWQQLPAAQPTEQEQSQFFCGVDFADGVLAVSVMRRRPDDVAEMIHSEQIEVAAQPQQAKPLTNEELRKTVSETVDGVTVAESVMFRLVARAAITAFCRKNGIKEQG